MVDIPRIIDIIQFAARVATPTYYEGMVRAILRGSAQEVTLDRHRRTSNFGVCGYAMSDYLSFKG